MQTSLALIAISLTVLVSYGYLHLARLTRIPLVVYLLVTGLALRGLSEWGDAVWSVPEGLLPLLGTVGLILIVLEGGLDLKIGPGRGAFHRRTVGAALAGLLLTTAGIGALLHQLQDLSWAHSLTLAIPFAVISSAVAISSADTLPAPEREFVVYESSWSDVLAVMLLNAALVALSEHGSVFVNLVGGGLAVLVTGTLLGLGMIWLVSHLRGHVKFLPMIFALTLVYGVAKALHLSPLLIVLMLGLMLNNASALLAHPRLQRLRGVRGERYEVELARLKHLTIEATFLVRTFFFLLLGYSIEPVALLDPEAWALALGMVVLIVALRWPVVRWLGVAQPRPLLWMMPRGLITVLLFFSVPSELVPPDFPPATLHLVVLLTCGVMVAGLLKVMPAVRQDRA